MSTRKMYKHRSVVSLLRKYVIYLFLLVSTGLLLCRCTNVKIGTRLLTVYTANGNLVGKSTASMYDQNVQSGGGVMIEGLEQVVSIARYKMLTFAAWKIESYDALGGGPLYKIYVLPELTGTDNKELLHDGGKLTEPALAAHKDRLVCMWIKNIGSGYKDKAYYRSIENARTWKSWSESAVVEVPVDGRSITGFDIVDHNGNLYMVGILRVQAEETSIFVSRISVIPAGTSFSFSNFNEDAIPGANPSHKHRISLASNGNRLSVAYVQDNSIRISHFENGSWSTPEVIAESGNAPVAGPALAYLKEYLYVSYSYGSVLTVRKQHENSNNWGPDDQHVNDVQVNLDKGVDMTMAKFLTN